jgi:hypothetical protein
MSVHSSEERLGFSLPGQSRELIDGSDKDRWETTIDFLIDDESRDPFLLAIGMKFTRGS